MGKSEYLSSQDYESLFENKDVKEAALRYALETRKFEIELYWKRATYFWLFIASIFTAYFLVLTSSLLDNEKTDLLILVSCVGVIFSFAWICVNRGSKLWQENWENHVYLLEDSVIGPLYKTVLKRPKPKKLIEKLLGPASFSVTKINLIISWLILIIWVYLLVEALPRFDSSASKNYKYLGLVITTLIFMGFVYWKGKSDTDEDKSVKNYEADRSQWVQDLREMKQDRKDCGYCDYGRLCEAKDQ